MGLATAAIVVGAVVAGAAVAGAVAKKQAADKAAKAQKKAIAKQKEILLKKLDPDTLNSLAEKADKRRAESRIALQKELDPELAELRQKGKEQLLAQASIEEKDKQSSQLADKLFEETKEQDPRIEALKDSLITRAQEEIDAGANLPPTFQAELVRSGLNQGAQAGIGVGRDQVGGGTARLLGAAGIQLQQARENQAINLGNAAQNLQSARVNILSSVFPNLRNLEQQRQQNAAANFGLGDAALPESGLTGREIVNIEGARQKGIANLIGQRGAVSANQALAQGEFVGSVAGAVASGVTSYAGAGGFGGGAGAGGYASQGGGGGGTSYLSGVQQRALGNASMGGYGQYGEANFIPVGDQSYNIGQYGQRTPFQQKNYQYVQSLYE